MTKKLVTVALMFALSACMATPGNKEQTIPALNIGKPQGGSYFDSWLQNSFDIPDALATQRYRDKTTTDEGQRDKWLATPITANSSRTANTSKVVEVKHEDIAAHFNVVSWT